MLRFTVSTPECSRYVKQTNHMTPEAASVDNFKVPAAAQTAGPRPPHAGAPAPAGAV